MHNTDKEFVRLKYLVTDRNHLRRTDVENLLCRIVEFESDVANGGFTQYFYNQGGDSIAGLRDNLVKIGCGRIADMLMLAVDAAGLDLEGKWQRFDDRILDLSERLRSIDEQFYAERNMLYAGLRRFLETNENGQPI